MTEEVHTDGCVATGACAGMATELAKGKTLGKVLAMPSSRGDTMKVAVSSTGKDLNCWIDPRFGWCQYFIIVDSDTMEFEVLEHEGLMAAGGTGIQAAQLIDQKGAKALITGNIGPNAVSALAAAGIKVYLVPGGTINDVIADYRAGTLREVRKTTVPSHFGMGEIDEDLMAIYWG